MHNAAEPLRAVRADALQYLPPDTAFGRWQAGLTLLDTARAEDRTLIEILDVIGADFFGEGVTAKTVQQRLAEANGGAIDVVINSPGGDYFEGLAIRSSLAAYGGDVRVRVLGIAASAASVIAMAGDRIEMAEGSFMMIHNASGVTFGTADDHRDVAGILDGFDTTMAGIYARRAEQPLDKVQGWMKAETFFGAAEAVDAGLADVVTDGQMAEENEVQARAVKAVRRVECALLREGMSRADRRSILSELKGGKPGAVPNAEPVAGDLIASVRELIETIRT
ncbi:MAG: head maturation protease, ClpP-related [Pseudomonadota bacterium]